MFFAALKWVVLKNGWLLETGSKTLIRDPEQARLGELLRFEFTIVFSLRADPLYELQNPVTKPTGAVAPTDGDPTIVVEVP